TDISLVAEPGSGRNETLPRNARIYFVVVAVATAAATLPFLGRLQHTHQWAGFLILGSFAAVAQLFNVRTPRDQAYHTAIVFIVAAALTLPPELVVLMGIVQHLPEWLKLRYRWYLQTFNICIFVLASMAVWFVARELFLHSDLVTNPALRLATAGLIACVVFVTINHLLLAVMLQFDRCHQLKETCPLYEEALNDDFVYSD